jgi:hypothetical protein
VKETGDPELALALAVLERVAADLRSKSKARREEARRDVASGGLRYWIDVVDGVFDAGERINQELARLVK